MHFEDRQLRVGNTVFIIGIITPIFHAGMGLFFPKRGRHRKTSGPWRTICATLMEAIST
jgi:hypothetical protein